ncbi:MAG: class I SAM-dependent methyltransferase [Deltaproteobacteria bacterium]|nr:class I SAM-dependent methyltransferase [Deltaproteobacteria bacterium]
MSDRAAALQARLKKNLRRLEPWARREDVSSFRVYDRDIPEVPLTVDRYQTSEGLFVHVTVFEPRHGVADAEVQRWADALCAELQVDRAHLEIKRRERGGAREKLAAHGVRCEAHEGGLRFLVNLTDYVDTGLFLDHRRLRARVRQEAAGRRFLNLFSYTGSFTVYAAAGGALCSRSIDLSPTYCRWTIDNLRLNARPGVDPCTAHIVEQADVFAWLEQPASAERFDLAVLDPPSVSVSKRARQALDVHADHPWLIARALERLAPGGVLYFSTNLQGFALGAVSATAVDDISDETLSPDFPRRPPIHRAWRIVK